MMKTYDIKQKSTDKFQYDKKTGEVILSTGEKLSEIFPKSKRSSDFKIGEEFCNVDGNQYTNLSIFPDDTGIGHKKYYLILGYTGDFVRDDDGRPMALMTPTKNLPNLLRNTTIIRLYKKDLAVMNYMTADGKLLFDEWYDSINDLGINKSNEEPIFEVERKRRYNIVKFHSEPIFKEWYASIKYMDKFGIFKCTTSDGYKTLMTKTGELLLDGDMFDNIVDITIMILQAKPNLPEFHKCAVVGRRYKEYFRILSEDLQEIKYEGHTITEIMPYSGKYATQAYEITDQNGDKNVIGRHFKTVSKEWFKEIEYKPDPLLVDMDLFVGTYPDGKSLIVEMGTQQILGNLPVKKYVVIPKSDTHKRLLCIKRDNDTCNIYGEYGKMEPYLRDWVNDIGETENNFIVVERNNKHKIFVSEDKKLIPGKDCIDGHACYIAITDNDKYIIFSYLRNNNTKLYIDEMEYDDVYDVESRYIIVKKDNLYNYFDTVDFKLVFNKWYEDVETYDPDNTGLFKVKENGEWKTIAWDDN